MELVDLAWLRGLGDTEAARLHSGHCLPILVITCPGDQRCRCIEIVFGTTSATSPLTSAPRSGSAPRCRPPAGDNIAPLSGLAASFLAMFEMPSNHGYPSPAQAKRGRPLPPMTSCS